jgi:glycerol-3-phosphate dehydrogenase
MINKNRTKNRNLSQLASRRYDLLVIGGGIYGACVAWDATLRGLSVALVDKNDFGHATSANSLKTIHGGLRYLQDANLKLVRLMINERKAFMQVAPHLVHPLACLMPTYKQFLKSKFIFRAALMVNDLVGFDRNQLPDPQKHLPRGRIITRQECLQLLPDITDKSFTGGALWYDAQMYNSERLTLSFILSAAQKGADVANYVKVIGFLKNDQDIKGVRVKDLLTGEELEIQARIVVNAAGPWIDHVLKLANTDQQPCQFYPSIAMNLVTRQIMPKYAFGLPSRYKFKEGRAIPLKKPRILFVSPWRNYSLVGTLHLPFTGCIDDYEVTNLEIEDFIDEINAACPGAALKKKDVYFVHTGFLPAEIKGAINKVELVRQGQICDHQKDHGIDGLITVVGVKYTTARYVAGQVVDLVFRKLGVTAPPCLTHTTPIYGGQIHQFDDFLTQAVALYSKRTSPEIIQNLIYSYGSVYSQVLNGLEDEAITPCKITKVKVLYSVRKEMAQKLTDVILRRTDLGSAAWPGETCLQLCAETMATELGWDQGRIEREINEVRTVYPSLN